MMDFGINQKVAPGDEEKALQLLQEKYQDIIERDTLTGIYNRRGFYTHTYNLLHDRADCQFDICCINIDKFKVVNDLFGTFAGDKLLNFLARHLREFVGSDGTFARLTADNFAICIPHTETVYEDVNRIVASWLEDYPLALRIVARCGFYYVHDNEVPVSIMCDRANMAIMEIKGNYEKNYFVYDDSIRNRILQEQEILNEMKTALEQRQFVVYYQPKFNMESGKVIGSEALVRWIHPTKGIISPGVFIPIFERNGFISSLDQYVWECVCQDIRRWIDEGYSVCPVSTNVSRAELYNSGLALVLSSMVDKYDIPVELLQLEITESAYTDNPEQLIDIVGQLKSIGFTILMDDFGSGYSSLNTLKDVPVDVLKLDLKFLYNMDHNVKANYILKSVVQMAKRLDLLVIAEGVETEKQADFLKSIGCVRAQGYLYARPMPRKDLEVYLSDASKVSVNDDDSRDGLINIDDIMSAYHQEDEIEWYRSAVIQLNAMLYEYNIENDVFTVFDMQAEDGGKELTKLELPRFVENIKKQEREFIYNPDAKQLVNVIGKPKVPPVDVRIKNLGIDRGFRWYRQSGRTLYNKEGKALSMVGVLQDITSEKIQDAMVQSLAILDSQGPTEESLGSIATIIGEGFAAGRAHVLFAHTYDYMRDGGLNWELSGRVWDFEDTELMNKLDADLDVFMGDESVVVLSEDYFEYYGQTMTDFFFGEDQKKVLLARHLHPSGISIIIAVSFTDVPKRFTEDDKKGFGELTSSLFLNFSELLAGDKEKANLELYSLAFKESGANIWEWNVNTKLLHRSSNIAMEDGKGEWVANVPYSFVEEGSIHPDYVDSYISTYERLAEGIDGKVMVKKLYADGIYRWLHIEYKVLHDDEGRPLRAIGFGENVNDIYINQIKIREKMRKSETIEKGFSWIKIDLTDDSVVAWSENLTRLNVGDSYQEMIDIMRETSIPEADREQFMAKLSRESLMKIGREGKRFLSYSYAYKSNESPEDELHYRGAEVDITFDENGHMLAFLYLSNIDERAQLSKYASDMNDWDAENWILGKESFTEIIKGMMADHPEYKGVLYLLDMDKFMLINESFGEDYSKEIISNVIAIAKGNVPHSAMIGKLSPDCFGIYVPDCMQIKDIHRLSNALQKSIYSAFSVGNTNYVLSASIGISTSIEAEGDVDKLFELAYDELAEIKELGR